MNRLTRRLFLAESGAGAALLASPSFLKADSGCPALGIQLYTVSAELRRDLPGTLAALRKSGYRFVEYYPLDQETPRQFRAAVEAAGLQCPSAHVNFLNADPAAVFDEALATGAHYAVSSMLMTNIAGSDTKHYGAHSDLTGDDFRRLAALANSLGVQAKKAGARYVYHNHNFEFLRLEDGGTGYDLLLKETDPELVKLELDCGWMAAAGQNPAAYLRAYRGRYRMIHVKDFLPVKKPTTALFGPGRPTGTELGRGFVDYKPIFAAAEASGVEYFFSEQEPPFADMPPLAAAQADYIAMRSLCAAT